MAKLAALLHDIGHGVNSHLLEKVTGLSHEARGIDIIRDPNTKNTSNYRTKIWT